MCSDGFFFAVKEVSLLATGNQGQQSIFQLEQVGRFCNAWNISSTFWGMYSCIQLIELQIKVTQVILIGYYGFFLCLTPCVFFQEISLLSQFEHENIVRYLGTDKVHDCLLILILLFVESIASRITNHD